MVPLLGHPFLAYQLALLRAHGVTDVILACSYRVDDVRQALGDGERLGVRLRYVVETEPLGTGGGVRNAADLARGTVWVLNGDVLTDADLTGMRRLHESRGSRTTIFLTPVEDPRAYGLVELHDDGRLARFREKPTAEEPITTNTINAGIYLIDATLLDRIPAGRVVSIEREFFPALIADGIPCYGWSGAAYWRDIGSPAAYRDAQVDLLRPALPRPARPQGRPGRPAEWPRPLAAAPARGAARRLLDRAERPRGPRRPRGRAVGRRRTRRVGRGCPHRPVDGHRRPLTDRRRRPCRRRHPLGARRRRHPDAS